MKTHLVLITDPAEQIPKLILAPGEIRHTLHLDAGVSRPRVRSNFWHVMDSAQLSPSDMAADLIRVAVTVYAADLAIPRATGFDNWARQIALYFPVIDVARWEVARPVLERFLNFLSGDRWEVHFRQWLNPRPPRDDRAWKKGVKPITRTVSLFSGGLDSFIGAVELTRREQPVCLVGHHDESITKNRQDRLYGSFRQHRLTAKIPLLQFYVAAPKLVPKQGEPSKRSRSFLFLSLGAVVANALDGAELVVPENGFIALNVPLATTRLGSLTTRTTHPFTLQLFQELLHALGIAIPVRNPYEFLTKGEMVDRIAADPVFLGSYEQSLSCAHPAAERWSKGTPGDHCGYCVPCIIRRAALNHAKLQSSEPYSLNFLATRPELGKSHDVRAFLLAIESLRSTSPIANVLATGPLAPQVVGQYVDVYRRGLAEVESLLRARRWAKFK